jgi:hypothetical protein
MSDYYTARVRTEEGEEKEIYIHAGRGVDGQVCNDVRYSIERDPLWVSGSWGYKNFTGHVGYKEGDDGELRYDYKLYWVNSEKYVVERGTY